MCENGFIALQHPLPVCAAFSTFTAWDTPGSLSAGPLPHIIRTSFSPHNVNYLIEQKNLPMINVRYVLY